MINLVIRVKEIRERNGYKQKEISDLLKIAPYVLSNYKTSRSRPDIEVLIKIASLYMVTLAELFKNEIPYNFKDKKIQELIENI